MYKMLGNKGFNMFSLGQFPLPFNSSALEPYMSEETVKIHHDKHLGAYIKNLNDLILKTKYEGLPLWEIIKQSAKDKNATKIFNNSAQVFNHNFFFQCLAREGNSKIPPEITNYFGSLDKFRLNFISVASSVFGSGWAWLIKIGKNKFDIIATSNADTPIAHGQKPILALDLWEHAYYLDWQNRRTDFIKTFLYHLVNWKFVAENLSY